MRRSDDGQPEPLGAVSLGEALGVVVRSLGRGPSDRSHGGVSGGSGGATVSVFRSWDAAVGASVAEHARPVSLDDGRLLVEVDQPGWATQLRFLSATLLGRLDAVVGPGVVRSIEVRVTRR